MLIEVMIGALILAITTTAVLNGLDGAQKTGGRNKARSVAAALAEQDQERMRSMSVETLANVPQLPAQTVDGAVYTIKSEAAWVNDDTGGTPACGNSSNKSEYFHIATPYSRTVPVNNVNYTVVSSAAYATDPGAVTTGCSATAKTQTNLKITSTVSSLPAWPVMTGFGVLTGRLGPRTCGAGGRGA